MSHPIIRQLNVGPFQVFTYLVACPLTRRAVVIDPGGEEERILSLIRNERLAVAHILNTHGHADHALGNQALKSFLRAPTCMHGADDRFFRRDAVREAPVREPGLPVPEPADIRLKHGDVLDVGTIRMQVIHTPGHSPGSVCYLAEGNLFTGDTLFVGAAGRTDLPGGSLDTLIESIEKRLLPLPPDTVIWPGHDYGETPSSTLAREMQENPYITDFILG